MQIDEMMKKENDNFARNFLAFFTPDNNIYEQTYFFSLREITFIASQVGDPKQDKCGWIKRPRVGQTQLEPSLTFLLLGHGMPVTRIPHISLSFSLSLVRNICKWRC